MEETSPERGAQRRPGPLSTGMIERNRPSIWSPARTLLAWAMQRHVEGLFALLLCQGRGAMHEWQLLRLGGTHGQRAPVLQPSFGGADRPPHVISPAPFCPHQRALAKLTHLGGLAPS